MQKAAAEKERREVAAAKRAADEDRRRQKRERDQKKQAQKRAKRREEAASKLVEHGVTIIIAPNQLVALYDAGQALRKESRRRGHLPVTRKCTHWICGVLGDMADSIDPSTYSRMTGETVAQQVRSLGKPDWIASTAGKAIEQISTPAFTALLPHAQLSLGLRMLAVLACPHPSDCTASDQTAEPVFKELLTQVGGR